MPSDIVWEDPPPIVKKRSARPDFRPGRGKWGSLLGQVRKKPGRWARIDQKKTAIAASGCARHLRNGVMQGYDPASYEFRSHYTSVYARYIGKGK